MFGIKDLSLFLCMLLFQQFLNRIAFVVLMICFFCVGECNGQVSSDLLSAGIEKYETGDYRNAIKDLDKVIANQPENAKAFKYRGLAKFVLRSYYASIEDFDQLLKIDPKDSEGYFVRALAKGKLERFREEIEDYNLAIQYDPENADIFFNRGAAKLQLKYYESAALDFSKVIALDPDHAAAYSSRGQARIASGEQAGGCDDLRKAGDMGFGGALPIIIKNCF